MERAGGRVDAEGGHSLGTLLANALRGGARDRSRVEKAFGGGGEESERDCCGCVGTFAGRAAVSIGPGEMVHSRDSCAPGGYRNRVRLPPATDARRREAGHRSDGSGCVGEKSRLSGRIRSRTGGAVRPEPASQSQLASSTQGGRSREVGVPSRIQQASERGKDRRADVGTWSESSGAD